MMVGLGFPGIPMPLLHLLIGLALGAVLAGVFLARRPRPADGLQDLQADLEGAALGAALIQDRTFTWVNARCAEILGADARTLAGAGVRAFHQDEAAFLGFGEAILGICERGETYRGEAHLRRADGSPFWAYLAGGLANPRDPRRGILWFVEDISERVEAQLDMAETLSLNQRLLSASPSAVLLYRAADGACVMANEAAARILGARQEDVLRQNFRRLRSWKETGLRDAADRALSTGLEQHLECHFTSEFGTEVWVMVHLVPFVSRGERILLVLADDVAERMKASSALRRSEERYRVVVEALSEGLAMVDPGGLVTFCNSRLREMGGYGAEELLGRPYQDFVKEADRPVLKELGFLSHPGRSGSIDLGLVRRDGSILDARVSIASLADHQGAPGSLAILVTDISVSKKTERERERLLGELEQKNKELETLLHVASHDLRSPLVNIQGFSQRLGRSLEELRKAMDASASLDAFTASAAPHLKERMPASLDFIRASGARMDAIINGLLTLSRAGRMVLRAETLDMNALLEACSATLAFQFQSAGGSLQVEELPPCRADAAQVAQILSNLLDNAIKYRDPGRPLKVRVSGGPSQGMSEYCVEDNGLGIAPEHQQRIWDIFQRLDPQGAVQGEGLGLTLVRRMAERNGGRVRVESAPGRGCRFFLLLPMG